MPVADDSRHGVGGDGGDRKGNLGRDLIPQDDLGRSNGDVPVVGTGAELPYIRHIYLAVATAIEADAARRVKGYADALRALLNGAGKHLHDAACVDPRGGGGRGCALHALRLAAHAVDDAFALPRGQRVTARDEGEHLPDETAAALTGGGEAKPRDHLPTGGVGIGREGGEFGGGGIDDGSGGSHADAATVLTPPKQTISDQLVRDCCKSLRG